MKSFLTYLRRWYLAWRHHVCLKHNREKSGIFGVVWCDACDNEARERRDAKRAKALAELGIK